MPTPVEPHAELIPGYKLIDRLGSGGFGEVWKAEAPGGLLKAIKIVHGDVRQLDPDGSHRAEQELRALQRVQSIRHPFLLSIERYDIIDGRLLIVTELADCNLYDRFEQVRDDNQPGIPRIELLRYLREAAEVLDLMNRQYQLQHLDIKPQNLFLIQDHVKVADFGLVKDLEGMRTAVSGGVTPVYAAPETFDGIITPFCDQYSLAIVYQELLTGHRPFSGTSMQQLVMQHLQAPPNLSPLPHADRPAVAKALAKKPENRHASCMALIDALSAATHEPTQRKIGARVVDTPAAPVRGVPGNINASIRKLERKDAKPYRPETPPTMIRVRRDEPVAPAVSEPAVRVAPPEFVGNGVLFPALIIGLGRTGLAALQRLRQNLCERYGGLSTLPHLKLLYIDTDPETAETAPRGAGGSALEPDEILLCRLNRASHYLKPRRNGRSLIEGWFDAQWLYRIPRNPVVQGQRALGRLVFGDCYQALVERFEELLETVTDPEALLRADRHTSLGARTNRPRVYVVANLSGGTGGGMFIDVAFALRNRLKFLGYESPQVTGLLTAPNVEHLGAAPSAATANTYAALTELVHYCHPDHTYLCTFDDRDAALTDRESPFDQMFVLSDTLNAQPGSTHDGAAQAAEYLARQLTQHFGKSIDIRRQKACQSARPTTDAQAATFGLTVLAWPRRALIRCASRRLCELVTQRWARRDATSIRPAVEKWVEEQWNNLQLGAKSIVEKLQQAVVDTLHEPPDTYFFRLAEPFAPKSWFGGTFDIDAANELHHHFQELMGQPEVGPTTTANGILSDVMTSVVEKITKDWGARLAQLAVTLIEQPEFRMSGAEEAIMRIRNRFEEICQIHAGNANQLIERCTQDYGRMRKALASPPSRKTASEFAELARTYPTAQVAAMMHRHVAAVYLTLNNDLGEQLSEIGFCRQRLDELLSRFRDEPELMPQSPHLLLPAGCSTPNDAVEQLVNGLTDEDLQELDQRMQKMVQGGQFTALVHVCLSTSNMLGTLEPAMLKLAQQFIAARVGEANATDLFFEKYSDRRSQETALEAFDDAAPPLGDTIGVSVGEIAAVCVPPGQTGERFAALVRQGIDDVELDITIGHDDIAFYRELPQVSLTRLPQLGPHARESYRQIALRDHFPPHTRTDVEAWHDVK